MRVVLHQTEDEERAVEGVKDQGVPGVEELGVGLPEVPAVAVEELLEKKRTKKFVQVSRYKFIARENA